MVKERDHLPAAVREYLREIGRRGGRSRSPRKLAAVRQNAKKLKTSVSTDPQAEPDTTQGRRGKRRAT